MRYVRPIFKYLEDGTVGDAIGSALLAYYRGYRMRISAAHVMRECGERYAMPSPTRVGTMLNQTSEYRTGERSFEDADISVRIFTDDEANNLTHTDYLEIEKFVGPREIDEHEAYHLVVGYPTNLQEYPSRLVYIEEVFEDARRGLPMFKSAEKEKLKEFVAVHYPYQSIRQAGEKHLGRDLGGCSGGVILTGKNGDSSPLFAGIILEQHPYKKADEMLIGIGSPSVLRVVDSAIQTL